MEQREGPAWPGWPVSLQPFKQVGSSMEIRVWAQGHLPHLGHFHASWPQMLPLKFLPELLHAVRFFRGLVEPDIHRAWKFMERSLVVGGAEEGPQSLNCFIFELVLFRFLQFYNIQDVTYALSWGSEH